MKRDEDIAIDIVQLTFGFGTLANACIEVGDRAHEAIGSIDPEIILAIVLRGIPNICQGLTSLDCVASGYSI